MNFFQNNMFIMRRCCYVLLLSSLLLLSTFIEYNNHVTYAFSSSRSSTNSIRTTKLSFTSHYDSNNNSNKIVTFQRHVTNKYRRSLFLHGTSSDNNNNKDDSSYYFAAKTTNTDTPMSSSSSSLTMIDSDSSDSGSDSDSSYSSSDIESSVDDALTMVGWSMPDGELTSNDPFVQQINDSIQNDYGVQLDELLNPAKVVNLERDLYMYRMELAKLTGIVIDNVDNSVSLLKTINCDGGGSSNEIEQLRTTINKKEIALEIERRSVFRGWLKNIFLIQAVLSFGLSYVMASNPYFLFGQFNWYEYYNMDLSISVLGYWWWWLFIIPSLRSRRPKGYEKNALDISFLLSPLISILAPIATKDTTMIWYANLLIVLSSYAFAKLTYNTDDNDDDSDDKKNTPEWLKFIYKSLDFGSGRERGARQ